MKEVQLARLVDTSRPELVVDEVKRIFSRWYSPRGFSILKKNSAIIIKLFKGRLKGYRACNTEYHNLDHTMDAFLATARLVDGRNMEGDVLDEGIVVAVLNAALLHDTGYIQESWDTEGTGAKYTSSHVDRSIAFLKNNRKSFSLDEKNVNMIERLIRCTGLSVDLDTIPFDFPEERFAGCMLGSADLLGQMSDRSYLEKLMFLYREFREAGIPGFNTEFDIIRKTVDFYEITIQRLKGPLLGVYRLAQNHFKARYSVDANLYMEAIQRHIVYLNKIIEDESTNFRHKLKRGDWVHAEGDRHHH